MPDVSTAYPEMDNMGPQELEAARRNLIAEMQTKYRGYDDPELPDALLHRLALITSKLRKKNAGPPKATKTPSAKKGPKITTDDLLL